jgi:hypothetical protein
MKQHDSRVTGKQEEEGAATAKLFSAKQAAAAASALLAAAAWQMRGESAKAATDCFTRSGSESQMSDSILSGCHAIA